MQRCREGDPAAFDALVRRWERPVARILASVGGSSLGAAFDVEDLSQEVFLRVFNARNRYYNGSAFSTWLYRIAVNVARDANRRNRTRQRTLESHRPDQSVIPDEAAGIVGRQEIENEVAAAVQSLPEKMRESLMLKQFGEMTFAEVAQILDVPTSTVKSRVHAALLRLRAELQRRGVDQAELKP